MLFVYHWEVSVFHHKDDQWRVNWQVQTTSTQVSMIQSSVPMKPFVSHNGIKWRVSPTFWKFMSHFFQLVNTGINVGLLWKQSGLMWTFEREEYL